MDELRLEPVPSGEINDTLAARVHDPLWFLARQWQLGEFQADDAGSPRMLEIYGKSHSIVAYALGDGDWQPMDPNVPLDVVVEAVPGPDWRLAIEAGAHFLRLLGADDLGRYRDDLIRAFAFESRERFAHDPLLAACASSVPDGEPLAREVAAFVAGRTNTLPFTAADRSTAVKTCKAWLEWYIRERGPVQPNDAAWEPHRLEHRVRVATTAAGGVVFRAGDYAGEGLDWCEFDILDAAELPDMSGAAARDVNVRTTPTPVTFGGMPAPRYWEFEDARFDYGNVDAAGHDLGRLLLVQFTMVFGNDWFLVPVPLEIGTVTLLDRVMLTDVFGRRFAMTRAGRDEPQWNLFAHATTSGTPHPAEGALIVAPVIGTPLTSEPGEVVHFMRDEMANLAWAIERYVETPLGMRVDRHAVWQRTRREIETGTRERPKYFVETEVPEYWIPLQPRPVDTQSIKLVVSPLLTRSESGFAPVEPVGKLLREPAGGWIWVHEEELPRAGMRVERLAKYGRWHDGTPFVWNARRKRSGRGEGSSGLRFDVLVPE